MDAAKLSGSGGEVMAEYTDIMAVEDWPSIPGHAGGVKAWSGKRKEVSDDGRYWLVKKMVYSSAGSGGQ